MEVISMDCPKCQGNGEIECIPGTEEQNLTSLTDIAIERASWPYTCPTCGGSGSLDELT
jgi:DnaJ-class molecular chaperone